MYCRKNVNEARYAPALSKEEMRQVNVFNRIIGFFGVVTVTALMAPSMVKSGITLLDEESKRSVDISATVYCPEGDTFNSNRIVSDLPNNRVLIKEVCSSPGATVIIDTQAGNQTTPLPGKASHYLKLKASKPRNGLMTSINSSPSMTTNENDIIVQNAIDISDIHTS